MCMICDQCDCVAPDVNLYWNKDSSIEANKKCNCKCDCAGCKDRRVP